jgi:putative transposase
LGVIVGTFKAAVTRRAGIELHAAHIWQRNYYEHVIRDPAGYERIFAYIVANPSNWEQDEERPR